jgi:hypothetical protein
MTKERSQGNEFSAVGKQTMAHATFSCKNARANRSRLVDRMIRGRNREMDQTEFA